MAATKRNSSTDPKSGFCSQTRIFHSLRPPVPLPPISQPLSIAQFSLSLLRQASTSTTGSTTCLANANTDESLSYSLFTSQVKSLAICLQKKYSLSRNDVAFILSPPSIHVPVLYYALLVLGVVISPANPLGSDSEIARQVGLSKADIAFATSQTAQKIPSLERGTILLDSPEFRSYLNQAHVDDNIIGRVQVSQSDPAVILYSSGTTGLVKAALMTHRNLIALIAGLFKLGENDNNSEHSVSLFTLPMFHVFGFFMMLNAISRGDTLVLMERFDLQLMLKSVEKYRITYMPVSPPLIVALAKYDFTKMFDLSSLQVLGSGGAPLSEDIAEQFKQKFPNVEIVQGYGLTESGGAVVRTITAEESQHYRSVGRLSQNMEAKIVDPVTGEALLPGQKGELWLRGPTIMKGYVGDDKATAEALDSEGWLKTGDLCYFDSEGYLFIFDRLKELIKYKGYQVPPAELEHLLQFHPEVADAAVIPYPDKEAGEIPMAFIVRKPGSNISAAQVMDFVAKQVAPYKKIRRVAFINNIPKSPAGKTLRKELIKEAVSGGSSKL